MEEAKSAPDDNNIENNDNYHYSIVPGMNIDADVGEGNVDGDLPKSWTTLIA